MAEINLIHILPYPEPAEWAREFAQYTFKDLHLRLVFQSGHVSSRLQTKILCVYHFNREMNLCVSFDA
jgi:hypothetical protein